MSSLWLNLKEHELLGDRPREAWGHDPMYCFMCWPEEFRELRKDRVMADMIWPPGGIDFLVV